MSLMSSDQSQQVPYRRFNNNAYKILCCLEDSANTKSYFTASYVIRSCGLPLSQVTEILLSLTQRPFNYLTRKFRIECPYCNSANVIIDRFLDNIGEITTCDQCYEHYEIDEDCIVVLYCYTDSISDDIIQRKSEFGGTINHVPYNQRDINPAQDLLSANKTIIYGNATINQGAVQMQRDRISNKISNSQIGQMTSGSRNTASDNTNTVTNVQNRGEEVQELLVQVENYLNTSENLTKSEIASGSQNIQLLRDEIGKDPEQRRFNVITDHGVRN